MPDNSKNLTPLAAPSPIGMPPAGPSFTTEATRFPAELLIWLSPAFPIGSFAYSQGLEWAVECGWINDSDTLQTWLRTLTMHGSLHNDLVLLSEAYRAPNQAALDQIAELGAALQPSAERSAEANQQGASFLIAYQESWAGHESSAQTAAARPNTVHTNDDPNRITTDQPVTLPIAVAIAARSNELPLAPTLEAYAIAFHSNLVSAAIRLSVIGQFDGQRILAALMPDIRVVSQTATRATLDDLGSTTFASDIAAMKHETQHTRLFRS